MVFSQSDYKWLKSAGLISGSKWPRADKYALGKLNSGMRSYISKLLNTPEIRGALDNPSGFVVRKVSAKRDKFLDDKGKPYTKSQRDIVRESGYPVINGHAIVNVGFKSRLKIDTKMGVRIFTETGKKVRFLQNPLDYVFGDKEIKLKQGEKIVVYCGSKSSAYSSVEQFEKAMMEYLEQFEDILNGESKDRVRIYIISGKMQSVFDPEGLKRARAAAKSFNAKGGVRK